MILLRSIWLFNILSNIGGKANNDIVWLKNYIFPYILYSRIYSYMNQMSTSVGLKPCRRDMSFVVKIIFFSVKYLSHIQKDNQIWSAHVAWVGFLIHIKESPLVWATYQIQTNSLTYKTHTHSHIYHIWEPHPCTRTSYDF